MTQSLVDRLPDDPSTLSRDEILELFLEDVFDRGMEPYPAQEEAILELFSGHHVVLNTPTGSGKSLVAEAMHFLGLANDLRSFYTSPIKALVSEKFFALCRRFGAENVGMLTGDASINRDASIICCTAEILSNMTLRNGEETAADLVCMDEFHYYADPDRGAAWQIPLLILENTRFLLMSATLGDVKPILDELEDRTGTDAAWVRTAERPVPLQYSYSKTPMHRTIERLTEKNKQPVYIVHFSQRAATEQAQAFTSLKFCTSEEKDAIAAELKGIRFDSPFGKYIERYVRHGVGVHHAGLLPRYRLLVEKLAQKGLLKVICGTDTLGVGINVPIRTVVFSALSKYDGQKVRLLSVREFKQIAGRAGRKGYDDVGYVVVQAPEHVIENIKRKRKAEQKNKKLVKKSPPDNFVGWNESTFKKLTKGMAEDMEPVFDIDHGILLQCLERDTDDIPHGEGYRALIELIDRAHVHEGYAKILRRKARTLFQSLVESNVVSVQPRADGRGSVVFVEQDLPADFSLFYTLSLYALDTLDFIDPDLPDSHLRALTVIESIIENPRAVLYKQENKLKDELLIELKAQGVPYMERLEKLDEVEYPKPNAEFIYDTYNAFKKRFPWAGEDSIKPKSVARDMYEKYMSFNEYVKYYGLSRSEGVLLRYLSQVYKALVQTIPESYLSEELIDLAAFLRAALERIDSSLVTEWEELREGPDTIEIQSIEELEEARERAVDISRNPRSFKARIRAEMHALVHALARKDYEEAEGSVRHPALIEARTEAEGEAQDVDVDDVDIEWDASRFEEALEPYWEQYDEIVFNHEARLPPLTHVEEDGHKQWRVHQVIVDPEGYKDWYVEASIDLREDTSPAGPMIEVVQISNF